MPKINLKHPGITYSACDHSLKIKKELKKLKKQEIPDLSDSIFIKMSKIKFVFNIIWLKKILKI